MTKLISGRVKKTPSANVSASRYEFIRLEETEPDLGVPAANGYILTANVDGTRRWIAIPPSEATTAAFATTAGTANTGGGGGGGYRIGGGGGAGGSGVVIIRYRYQ